MVSKLLNLIIQQDYNERNSHFPKEKVSVNNEPLDETNALCSQDK